MEPARVPVRRPEAIEDDGRASPRPSRQTVVLPWRYRAQPAGLYRGYGKRWLDVLLSAALLIGLLPLLMLVAIAVLMTSGRPALYDSERVGKNGTPITVWKFRTMVRDADRVLQQWMSTRPDLAALYGETFKLANDPRITPLGRCLRKTSLDELPQLWSVLRGDMSLVGPRPVPQRELEEKYGPLGDQAFAVRPGMTGMWQVNGRSEVGYTDRVRLDCEYAARLNLLLDVKILALTVPAVLFGRGAE